MNKILVDDQPFEISEPITDSDGTFTYTSNNESVATISGTTVTIVGAGQTTITATQAATAIYNSGTITATLTVRNIIELAANGKTLKYYGNYIHYTPRLLKVDVGDGDGEKWFAVLGEHSPLRDWFVVLLDYYPPNQGIKDMFTPPNESSPIPIKNIVTTLVTNMGYIFADININNENEDHDITSFDTSSVTNFGQMFMNTPFNRNINHWDVSKGTIFNQMFRNTPFNQPLNNWNVGSATDVRGMFLYNTVFKQDISSWHFNSFANLQYLSLHDFNGSRESDDHLPNQMKPSQ
jgi:hypothetical protein